MSASKESKNISKLAPLGDSVLVVMAGGSGTRFWPMSRTSLPKQFLPLGSSGKPLIEEAVSRFKNTIGEKGTLVVTAESQSALVNKILPNATVLAEPMAKNTAPCLAFAAHYVLSSVGDKPMICIPADHVIDGEKELLAIFKKACDLAAKQEVLITLGIKPSSPETGYGYIKSGNPYLESNSQSTGAFLVSQFVEKPDLETAKHYVESGDFFWNSGMFVWRPSVLIKAFETYLPDISKLAKRCVEILNSKGSQEELASVYEEMQSVSIDVGIMEEAKNAVVFPCYGFKWSDVGSWSSWSDTVLEKMGDGHDNVFLGDVLSIGAERCTVVNAESEQASQNGFGIVLDNLKVQKAGEKLVALVGIDDVVVVNLPDSILICKKDETQKVKQVVELLNKMGKGDLV